MLHVFINQHYVYIILLVSINECIKIILIAYKNHTVCIQHKQINKDNNEKQRTKAIYGNINELKQT